MGAGESDPVQAGCGIEIWRTVKAHVGKIGASLEGAVGEIGFAVEARVRE
jgi:hypothetical protein